VHLVQAIPRALGTVIPGTAHLPNLEQPEAFNGHLKAFLDGF
jgi:pimeloyl-ACP methyl ester carboxylesterase